MKATSHRVYRPNKIAQGMSETYERSKKSRLYGRFHKGDKHDVLMLLVRGTCDPSATSMRAIGKKRCPCCNGTGRSGYELTDTGKRKLARMRKERG